MNALDGSAVFSISHNKALKIGKPEMLSRLEKSVNILTFEINSTFPVGVGKPGFLSFLSAPFSYFLY